MFSAHYGAEQGEEATEFRPWRFVGKSKTSTKVGPDYLPFGMGNIISNLIPGHACPGRFLAVQELKVIGSMIASRYSNIEWRTHPRPRKFFMHLLENLLTVD
ncbi:hypothetical protein BGZ76_000197 [Entomortierella beljakovae]|nr:hypothetical protein BGZ76_000197 [Entomortierella beljakovae]